MGCNFYWSSDVLTVIEFEAASVYIEDIKIGDGSGILRVETPDHLVTGDHLGKRSAAGAYCWDCDITLCKEGKDMIHSGLATWHTACPKCGKVFNEATDLPQAALIELGMVAPKETRARGVQSCSSFSWAIDPEMAGTICRQHWNVPVVVDEYDRPLTGDDFINMLRYNCPIQFTDSIGEAFC